MGGAPGTTQRTRDAIVQALADLLAEEHPAAVSVPNVAERAGVSVRTVYRYFPTKADLLDAAASRFHERVRPESPMDTDVGLHDYLLAMWTVFAEDVDAVRAEHQSPAGRALRARRLPGARQQVGAVVDDQLAELSEEDRRRLVDLLITVTGSAAFLELVDRLGHPPHEAAAMATWAVQALTETARRHGTVGRGAADGRIPARGPTTITTKSRSPA